MGELFLPHVGTPPALQESPPAELEHFGILCSPGALFWEQLLFSCCYVVPERLPPFLRKFSAVMKLLLLQI